MSGAGVSRDLTNAVTVADLTLRRGKLRRRLAVAAKEACDLRREIKRLDGEIEAASEAYETGQVGLFSPEPAAEEVVDAGPFEERRELDPQEVDSLRWAAVPGATTTEKMRRLLDQIDPPGAPAPAAEVEPEPAGEERRELDPEPQFPAEWGEVLLEEASRRRAAAPEVRAPFCVPVDRPVAEVLAAVAPGRYVGIGPRGSVGPPEVLELHRNGAGELYGLTVEAADKRRRGVGNGGEGLSISKLRGWRFEPA